MSNICFICKKSTDNVDIFELGLKNEVFQLDCKDTSMHGMAVFVCKNCQANAVRSLILNAVSELRDKR